MRRLNPRERRLVAIALLLAALVLPYLLIVAPIVDGFSARAAERAQMAQQLEHDRRMLGSVGVWRARAQAQRLDRASYALAATSPAAASEAAIQRVSASLQAVGGKVRSVREQPGSAGQVHVRAEAQLSLTQLAAVLKVVGNQKPCIVVEGLSIAADQAAAAGRLSPMDVRIDLAVPYVVTSG